MKKLFSLLTLALLTLSAWAGTPVTDVITASNLAATGTSYTDFSGVTITSNAVYAGQSAKSAEGAIQLRSKNSNSGIVSTTSGGKLVSIKIDVQSGTNTIEVYGNTNAYTSAANLYDTAGNDNQGTKLGELSDDGTITVDGDYQFVGIRSKNGAVYISSIEITWESEGGVTPPDPTYTEVANLAAANALDSAEVFKFKGNAVVTYQNGKYLYLRDSSGYGLIFNKNANIQPTFTPGDVLAQDWTATKTNYQGYAEYVDYSTLSANGTNAELAAVQVINASDMANMINAYVKFEHVKSMNSTAKTATLADGTTIALHTTFATIPNFEDGDYYMTGIVSKYNGNLQLLLIDTDYEAPVEDDITTLDQANNLEDGVDFTFKGDAVVTYHNGKYLFLRDNSGYGLIYYTSVPANNFANGVVLSQNWTAQKTTYHSLIEYQNPANVTASNTTNAELAAVQVINASDMANMINAYVKIEHVKSISGTTATLTDGSTITLFKRFNNCPIVEFSDADCSITGIVSIYDETLQLYFISTDYVAPAGVNKPVITPNGGTFANEVEVTITCDTEDAEIIYTINNGAEMTYSGPFTLTESATVKAYAATDDAESEMAEATFTIVPVEEATYALVTDVTTLADGDKIIIVNANEAGEAYAMGAAYSTSSTSYFQQVSVNIAENLTITTADANVITLGANGNNWTLKATEGYLAAASSSKNFLVAKAEVDSNAIAAIAIADTASIVFQGNFERNIIRYNAQNTRFSCYGATNTQAPVYIYKLVQDQPEVKLGDVNKDGVIRIDDVTALIDALLGGNTDVETEHYSPANADVNQDTFIRIDDVTALIDMLLSGAAK